MKAIKKEEEREKDGEQARGIEGGRNERDKLGQNKGERQTSAGLQDEKKGLGAGPRVQRAGQENIVRKGGTCSGMEIHRQEVAGGSGGQRE